MQCHVGYSQHFTRELYLQYVIQHIPNTPLYLEIHNSSEISTSPGTWQTGSPLSRSSSCEPEKKKKRPINGNAYAAYGRNYIKTEKKLYSLYQFIY